MQIYLPIAEIPVDIFLVLLLGVVAGILAGMFGVGGGFIMTPMLIFMGISPAVAVASSANQIIASSVSGFRAHFQRKNVDFKMGGYMLAGGFAGSIFGTLIFTWLKQLGQIDLVISLLYVFFLGGIGIAMGLESWNTIKRKNLGIEKKEIKSKVFYENLPWKVHFPHSELEVSLIIPVAIGLISGVIVSIMGIGGGFLTIPAMIYILRMPTSLVIGTSLFQMILITIVVTFMHAFYSQTVDILLAMLLLTGSVVGAQIGTKLSYKLPAEKLRGLLALLVLAVAFRMGIELFVEPNNPFSISVVE
jgi:uncharacterized membrane protein YfcA